MLARNPDADAVWPKAAVVARHPEDRTLPLRSFNARHVLQVRRLRANGLPPAPARSEELRDALRYLLRTERRLLAHALLATEQDPDVVDIMASIPMRVEKLEQDLQDHIAVALLFEP